MICTRFNIQPVQLLLQKMNPYRDSYIRIIIRNS